MGLKCKIYINYVHFQSTSFDTGVHINVCSGHIKYGKLFQCYFLPEDSFIYLEPI